MNFEFATAARIIFGTGSLGNVGAISSEIGSKAFVVTGRDKSRVEPLLKLLKKSGVAFELFSVFGEPTLEIIGSAVSTAREKKCDMTIGFGGGSAIDSAKAVAALLTNPGILLDYLEVIGEGRVLERPAAPCIAVPTTAGTGAEVTRNSVIQSTSHNVKVSLRSAHMLPNAAIVDPELTRGLPPEITAATGMDALSQLIEPLVSPMSNALVRALFREGISRASRARLRAFESGDPLAREDMCLASLLSGLALANGKLGAVHGIAGPFGGMFDSPHGSVCGRLLGPVMRANIRALENRDGDSKALERYDDVARLLTNRSDATASDGVEWVDTLCEKMGIPALSTYGLTFDQLGELTEKSKRASSMKGNPIALTNEEIGALVKEAM